MNETNVVPNPAIAMMKANSEVGPTFNLEAKLPARLVVVEQVSHHRENSDPFIWTSRYSVNLIEQDEQSYSRELTADEKWIGLDCGWFRDENGVKSVSQLLIDNREGGPSQTYLTEEQKSSIEARVIEVSLRGDLIDDVKIPPRERMAIRPSNLSKIKLRCSKGRAKICISLIPA